MVNDRRLQAVEVQRLCAFKQIHTVRSTSSTKSTSNTGTQSKLCIVRPQLVLRVGRLDRTGSPEFLRDPAGHQKSRFGVARPACGSSLRTNDDERRDVGRDQAFNAGLQRKFSVFVSGRCRCGFCGASGKLP